MSSVTPGAALTMRTFAAGFLDTPEDDTLPLGATPNAANCELASADPGGRAILRKRRGSVLVNPTPIAAGKRIDGLFELRRTNAASQLVAVCDGKVWTWDESTTWTQVGATAPFTAGNHVVGLIARNRLWLCDGTAQRVYDGTTLREVGFAAPATIANMTAGAGPGPTNTYEAFYTWYDSATDHESSPSATTATLAVANQSRVHTKPSSAAPSWATHWRAYVRNVTTNETNWYRVGTVVVATGTLTEAIADTLRRDPGPQLNANDAPPTFALLAEWNGFGIGVTTNSDEYYVSKANDLESWHPSDRFRLNGGGEPIRAIVRYGTECWLQTPHSTFRLTGTAVPFGREPVHPKFGQVSADSWVEVDAMLYGWDRVRGPYKTDGVSWEPLGDQRITTFLDTVNRTALDDIRVVHVEAANLVIWSLATGSSSRKRTMLAYHYRLNAWLPPWTGLEIGALASYTTAAGALGVYAGDHWGRVVQLLTGAREGIPDPDATVLATVTSATANSVTAAAAAFYTTGAGCAGLPVAVVDTAGNWQWRRIASNTGTAITLDTTNGTAWSQTPEAGWTVVVGGIDWNWTSSQLDFGRPDETKVLRHLYLQGRTGAKQVTVTATFDEQIEPTTNQATLQSGSSLWGAMVWGEDLWGVSGRSMRKKQIPRAPRWVQIRLANGYADQPVDITMLMLTADPLTRRKVASVSDE